MNLVKMKIVLVNFSILLNGVQNYLEPLKLTKISTLSTHIKLLTYLSPMGQNGKNYTTSTLKILTSINASIMHVN